MKNRLLIFLSAAVAFCCCGYKTSAQDEGYDVFVPIAKYIRLGDAEKLSAWFDDSLEISIISNTSDSPARIRRNRFLKHSSTAIPREGST